MVNFFEIDFLQTGNKSSGDAIALRYSEGDDIAYIHVIDGGYRNDGPRLAAHIREYYENDPLIDHVVLTHPDGDHAAGLKTILEDFEIGELWMNRPWNHIADLLPRFNYEYTEAGLIQRLKKDFPYTAELEAIADEKEILINDAFQGDRIGAFTVLGPSGNRYLDLIVKSEKTPEPEREAKIAGKVFEKIVTTLKQVTALWGEENLKGEIEGTSCENEMSVVQFAELSGEKILLTGDAGVETLEEAYQFAAQLGVALPGIDRFQVPHHGSRRNLSPGILDKWLGEKLDEKTDDTTFTAIVSANKNDEDHPRKAIVRALIHRGAKVITTKDFGAIRTQKNAPDREGWKTVTPLEYPEDTED